MWIKKNSSHRDAIILRLQLVPVIHFAVNVQGGVLTLIYFAVVEQFLFEQNWGSELPGVVELFAVMLLIVSTLHPFVGL